MKVRNPEYYPTEITHFCVLLHFRCRTNKASPKIPPKEVNPTDLLHQPQGVKVNKISYLRPLTPCCIKKVSFKYSFACIYVEIFRQFLHGSV